MAFLSRLFKPKEVRDVLFALDSLDEIFEGQLGWRDVKANARQTIVGFPEVVKRGIIVDRRAPLDICFNLVVNHCFRDLSSGFNHSYRGVLSMGGRFKRAIFYKGLHEMVSRGFLSEEEADEQRSALAIRIAEAG